MSVFAFCQHRLGRTDGVSLEVDKWRRILEGMGHTVHYISGNDDVPGGNFVPELYPFHPTTKRILRNATVALTDYANGAELMRDVRQHADVIKRKMAAIIENLKVDVMLPNNLLSVGYNLAGMVALSEILEETGMKTICHSHDFWWEDSGEVEPTCDEVVSLYMRHAPPAYPNVHHVVINRLAQAQLLERRGLEATVVPNVFDFSQPQWETDEYNSDFREAIGLKQSDIMFLQATRVLDRKAIELAIDVVGKVNEPSHRRKLEASPLYDGRNFGPSDRIALVCAGYVEGIGLSDDYHANLDARAEEKGVEILWVGDMVKHSRGRGPDGSKLYSLWDSYVSADFVTYPSIWEGWGNQFIEALFAKLPVVLFEYPVYTSDLKAVGFDVVSLGDQVSGHDARGLAQVPETTIEEAAKQVVKLLLNADARSRTTEGNFALARTHFSLQALETIIRGLLDDIGMGSQQQETT